MEWAATHLNHFTEEEVVKLSSQLDLCQRTRLHHFVKRMTELTTTGEKSSNFSKMRLGGLDSWSGSCWSNSAALFHMETN